MTTNYRIIATAPTVYQLSSIRAFGLPVVKQPNGSFIAEMGFASKDEAIDYLKERAWEYNNQDGAGEAALNEMYEEIENGALSLDAVTATIEAI